MASTLFILLYNYLSLYKIIYVQTFYISLCKTWDNRHLHASYICLSHKSHTKIASYFDTEQFPLNCFPCFLLYNTTSPTTSSYNISSHLHWNLYHFPPCLPSHHLSLTSHTRQNTWVEISRSAILHKCTNVLEFTEQISWYLNFGMVRPYERHVKFFGIRTH